MTLSYVMPQPNMSYATYLFLLDDDFTIIWGSYETKNIGRTPWDIVSESDERSARYLRKKLIHCADTGEKQRFCFFWTVPDGTGLVQLIHVWHIRLDQIGFGLATQQIDPAIKQLSSRELEVAKLLSQGHSMQAVAKKLNIAVGTAHTHAQRIRSKLGLDSLGELMVWSANQQPHTF